MFSSAIGKKNLIQTLSVPGIRKDGFFQGEIEQYFNPTFFMICSQATLLQVDHQLLSTSNMGNFAACMSV
ncbi:uncharacterized protein Dvar_40310 [Desulfosarcina variabilis str. Montpellier]